MSRKSVDGRTQLGLLSDLLDGSALAIDVEHAARHRVPPQIGHAAVGRSGRRGGKPLTMAEDPIQTVTAGRGEIAQVRVQGARPRR